MIPNTAILTTVANFDLYKKSSEFFPKNIPLYVIDGRNGMHGLDSILFMFKKLKNSSIEWLIMADEDVIFWNNKEIFGLIEYMKEGNYSVCGVRDGGVISHRIENPYCVNTFFTILNFKKIKPLFDKTEVLNSNYIFKGEFDDDLTNLTSQYNSMSLFEPYYRFFLWLRRGGHKFFFLDAEMYINEPEGLTNIVKSFNGQLLLYHTWHARSYGINQNHTLRINKVLAHVKKINEEKGNFVLFVDKWYSSRKFLLRIVKRLKIKKKAGTYKFI